MSKKSNYWEERIQEQADKLFDKTAKDIDKELIRKYKQAYDDTVADMVDLWDKLVKDSADGKVKPNDLYRYNRYYQIRSKLNERLVELGAEDKRVFEKGFKTLYKQTQTDLESILESMGVSSSTFTLEQETAAKNIINSVWCADGQHWSDRVWKNKSKLQDRIEKGLMDCVSRGVGKDELIKTLKEDFNQGFHEADRLARTELTYVQNQAAKDRYEAAGIKKYKFLAEIDSRTSSICRELNGKQYNFTQCSVGANMPPMHPYCRSTIIPVVE